MPPKRSEVSKHFTLASDKKSAKCNLCGVSLTYASTTPNLKNHLQVKPSINLLSTLDVRKFSHVAVNIQEAGIQTEHSCQIEISRDVYTQKDVDAIENSCASGPKDIDIKCTKPSAVVAVFRYLLPIFATVRTYDFKQYILGDFLGGISVACLHFPQGLAYGILASLTPVQGLYTSFFPVLFYVLFGTVQHMAIGTDSIVAIMIAEILETQATNKFPNATLSNDKEILRYKTGVSMTITLTCGFILVAMAVFRLGFLTTYQSKSFIGGFTTAAAFHIFTSQVPKALGITVPLTKGIGKMVNLYIAIVQNIGQTNVASVILVIICVIFIMFIKDFINTRYRDKMKFSIPADLLAIIIATIVSKFADINGKFGIELVGDIPSGVPLPGIPDMAALPGVIAQSFEIAVLIFFLSIAMVKVCAEKHEYEVHDNRELMAYGLTNICCSFFPCFPPSTSPPRNMILSNMGARTTLNGVFTAIIMVLVLLVLGELFASLPVPALAAMIFVSVKPLLLQTLELRKIFRINKMDFIIWIVSCLVGILMDLPYGLIFGVGTSFFTVIVQNQRHTVSQLFYRSDHQLFVTYKSPVFSDQMKSTISVCRLNTSLYFATSDRFRKSLYKLTVNPLRVPHTMDAEVAKNSVNSTHSMATESSLPENSQEFKPCYDFDSHRNSIGIKIILLDCSCVSYIDIQGVNTLSVVFEEYRRIGVTILMARCGHKMLDTLEKAGFFIIVSKERVFYDLLDAFQAAKLLLE